MKSEITISREQFLRYVRVQKSGVTNMLSPDVQILANLSSAAHLEIIKNYSKYSKLYNISMDNIENEDF